jgi:hypothetical protein
MGGQQESGNSDSHVFGGAVPPAKPCDTGAFLFIQSDLQGATSIGLSFY